MKIKRLFMPLGMAAVILMSLTVLLLPDFGIVFAQDSRTATREARQVTRTALAVQYANAQSTYDAGLARLASIRITGTAYARATATSRAAGYARATANKIYVSTANAVSDARSTVHAATQRVVAPLTATAGAQHVNYQVGQHQTRVAVDAQSAAAIQTQLLANFSGTERATATAQAVRYSTVEAKHATSQAKAAVQDRQRQEQWAREEATHNAVRTQIVESGNEAGRNETKSPAELRRATQHVETLCARGDAGGTGSSC